MHLVLGHERVGVRRLLERHELGERLVADDDPGGVGRRVAGDALELAGEVGDPLDRRVALDHAAQLRGGLDRLVEPDPELVRDGLRDPVDLAVAVAEHAPDVADRRPGEHRAERDDLGDVVGAVLAGDVGDHLVAPAVLEVDVDVGHRHPVRVEEALERQLVGDRVDRRDPEGVGHDRAGRAAPARRLDPLLAGEPDEVGDDEEVAGVAHREDHAELVVEPGLELRGHRAVAPFEAALALLAEPALRGLAVGHREVRDPEVSERQLEVGHLRDQAGVADGLGLIGEEGGHLGGRLQPEVARLELHPVGRVDVVAGPDAEQDVVGVGLDLVDVVEVVRHDERQARLRGEPQELLVEHLLLGHAVVLELEEEVARAEDLAVLAGDVASEVPVVDLERPRDLAAEAGAQPDEALAVPGEMLAIDPRLVVVAVDMGVGDEPAEVAIADVVLRQEDQVEGLGVGLALLLGHRPAGDVRLDADDRLDALVDAGLVEADGAVERAVIGDGEAVEALLGRRIDEVRDPPEAVEEAELGVDVEVSEVVRGEVVTGGQW